VLPEPINSPTAATNGCLGIVREFLMQEPESEKGDISILLDGCQSFARRNRTQAVAAFSRRHKAARREKMSLLSVHGRKDVEPNDQNENPYAQQFPAAPAK